MMDGPYADTTLVARIKEGDLAAFESLAEAYYKELLTYITYAINSEDIASDLLQDLFVQLWNRRFTLPTDVPIKLYLIGAARHRILDYLRTTRRTEKQLASYAMDTVQSETGIRASSDPLADLERQELARAVREAVNHLPERGREIWALSREQGLTFPEIAVLLGVSINTVKTHMARATAVIRKALGPFLSLIVLFPPR